MNNTLELRIRQSYYLMKRRTKRKGFQTIIDKSEFETFARNSTKFKKLFNIWKTSNYPLSLTPTVDRIDNNVGYTKENIQFLSYRDNQSKGSVETKVGKHKLGKPVIVKNNITGTVVEFVSGLQASQYLKIPKTTFYSYLQDSKAYKDMNFYYKEV